MFSFLFLCFPLAIEKTTYVSGFENLSVVVRLTLQAMGLPPTAAQRGGASAAAAAMTASVHSARRDAGRGQLAQIALSDLNALFARSGVVTITAGDLPQDPLAAFTFLTDQLRSHQGSLTNLLGTPVALPETTEDVEQNVRAADRLFSFSDDLVFTSNALNSLAALSASLVGRLRGERNDAEEGITTARTAAAPGGGGTPPAPVTSSTTTETTGTNTIRETDTTAMGATPADQQNFANVMDRVRKTDPQHHS